MALLHCAIVGVFYEKERIEKEEIIDKRWWGGLGVVFRGRGEMKGNNPLGETLSYIHATTPSIIPTYKCKQRRVKGLVHPTHAWVGAWLDELIHPSIHL